MAAVKGKLLWIAGVGIIFAVLVAVIAVSFLDGRPGPAPESSATPKAPSPSEGTTAAPPPRESSLPPSSAPASKAADILKRMTLEQKVGQVLMVSSPVTGADAAALYALDELHVGNVFLKGRSTAGQAGIAAEVAGVRRHISGTLGVRPFVATDQEGGLVQIMRGPGFSEIPQAIEQGQLPPAQLESQATLWGQELAAVGVNVNLAPVMDTVPGADFAPQNAPIGAFGREYGYTPQAVSSHGIAFAKGMMSAGVEPAVKHFPGLGRVTENTDVAAGVVDNVTVRNDAFLKPFADAVDAGVPWLMISNALYPKIDAEQLAPFSPVIVQDMVRGDLGFEGIIVSDDICDAVAVSGVPVARRGVDFIAAGGTMALCTNQALLPEMYNGLVAAAQSNPRFAEQLDSAALLALQAKDAKGLID